MKEMNILDKYFKENKLEYINKTFVLAVSTGVDSSVLLDMFIQLQKEVSFNIVVCHCNHHKRSQSDIEEQYIKDFCLNNNIVCYVNSFDFTDLKNNFQAVARKRRYQFFNEVIELCKADYLVLAHHADDLLETILLRFARGSSLAGYAGIKPVYNKCVSNLLLGKSQEEIIEESDKSYYIIRPLLSMSKESIIDYALKNNVKYFEDESNDSNDYARNRLRHNVIPLLKEEYPNILEKAQEFSQTIREASLICNTVRDDFIHKFVKKRNNKIEFKRSDFLSLSEYMQEEVLFELLKKNSLSKANIFELLKIIRSKIVNYQVVFKDVFDFLIAYDNIFIEFKYLDLETDDKKLIDDKTNININDKILKEGIVIDKIGKYFISDKIKINVSIKSNNGVTNLNQLWYNISDFPITIRTRRSGDKIKISNGYKKIKDILIDLKIPMQERNNLLLACDKNNEVLIIFGIRKSDVLKNYKLNCEGTQEVCIEMEEN